MTGITQADVDAAIEWYSPRESEWQGLLAEHFARHREQAEVNVTIKIIALASEWLGDIEFAQFKHALIADDQFLDPNHYWYRQGKDDGIDQERGNIVEWLRSDRIVLSMDGSKEDVIASAIEAGDHLK